ncbi:MAG: glycoside hydrolase family 2 TIM barrel-domain containing protein [Flavobacterium sp.]
MLLKNNAMMKNMKWVGCMALFLAMQTQLLSQSRIKSLLNENWEFTKDSTSPTWEKATLPHTPHIEPLIVNNQWQGDAWYRKNIELNEVKKRQTSIYFEGVMHECWIWLNGKMIKHHQGGYTPFYISLNEYGKKGMNELIVKINNEDNPQIPPGKPLKELDFNYYGGIYRNVWSIETSPIHFTPAISEKEKYSGGISIHFNDITTELAKGQALFSLRNHSNKKEKVQVILTFEHRNQSYHFESTTFEILPQQELTRNLPISIPHPQFWDIETPHLYQINAKIVSGKKEWDIEKFTSGIRTFELKPDGFYLNKKKRFLNGTNRHQEYPYLGYAISDASNYRDAIKIKNAGFDFVRLSHYPQSESFMQACDELGLITMNCISGWQFVGDDSFIKNALQEIRTLARRDRNRASVAFWEVSLNESNMSEDFMKMANETLRNELPFANIYTAGWMDHSSYDLFIPARQHGKAPQYWNNYDKGNRKIIIAEYGDWEYYAQNAGFNQTSFTDLQEEERTSRQLRGFGEKRLLQQAFNYQEAFNSNLKGVNTIGHANWLMFDYNRGYADDLESSGISDIFRIEKPAFYFYKSQRPPTMKVPDGISGEPMVHIASFWNEKSSTDLRVFSNCEEVALYLNGTLIDKKRPQRDAFSDTLPFPPFHFEIKSFQEGTLKAVGYINNEAVTEHLVTTPRKAHEIKLSFDESTTPLLNNQQDEVFVYASITDVNGTLLSDAAHEILFTVEGKNARIVGQNPIIAEAGIATILLQTQKREGSIKIMATTEGFPVAELIIPVP